MYAVFLLFDHLWAEMNAQYGTFSVVIEATTACVVQALDVARGDQRTLQAELRRRTTDQAAATPVTPPGPGPPPSSSSSGWSGDAWGFHPTARPEEHVSDSRVNSSTMGDLLQFSPPTTPLATAHNTTATAGSRATIASGGGGVVARDPFAGNDLIGLDFGSGGSTLGSTTTTTRTSNTSTSNSAHMPSTDPFADLLN